MFEDKEECTADRTRKKNIAKHVQEGLFMYLLIHQADHWKQSMFSFWIKVFASG